MNELVPTLNTSVVRHKGWKHIEYAVVHYLPVVVSCIADTLSDGYSCVDECVHMRVCTFRMTGAISLLKARVHMVSGREYACTGKFIA
jgi:hypothetical protein